MSIAIRTHISSLTKVSQVHIIKVMWYKIAVVSEGKQRHNREKLPRNSLHLLKHFNYLSIVTIRVTFQAQSSSIKCKDWSLEDEALFLELKTLLTKQSLTSKHYSSHSHSLFHALVKASFNPEVSSRNIEEDSDGPAPHTVAVLHMPEIPKKNTLLKIVKKIFNKMFEKTRKNIFNFDY